MKKYKTVQAIESIFIEREPVEVGEIVEIDEDTAAMLISCNRVKAVTEAEVQAAMALKAGSKAPDLDAK